MPLDRNRLAEALKMGRICAQRVLALLEQERTALAARDGAAIEKLIPLKLQAFERWEQTEQQRRTLLQQAGFATDHGGMQQCLAQHDVAGKLDAAWQELLRLTQQCQQENATNSSIIEISRRQTTDALAILSGQSVKPTGYAASGDAQRTSDHRLLGEA